MAPMQGALAQMVALTCHGNAAIRGIARVLICGEFT